MLKKLFYKYINCVHDYKVMNKISYINENATKRKIIEKCEKCGKLRNIEIIINE